MSEVISLDDHRPHTGGPARCLSCKHEWHAIAPVGNDFTTFECPKCALFKGTYIGVFAPKDDAIVWTCKCGNDRFLIMPDGVFCEFCGVTHDRDCGR